MQFDVLVTPSIVIYGGAEKVSRCWWCSDVSIVIHKKRIAPSHHKRSKQRRFEI